VKTLTGKQIGLAAAAAVLVCLLCSAAAQLLLRNLYRFLSFDQRFPAIFAQIRTAEMLPPAVLLFLSALAVGLLGALCRNGRVAPGVFVPVAVLAALLLPALAVLLTRVNGILFSDVLFSLIRLLSSGVL
jgi:hypothetical protein